MKKLNFIHEEDHYFGYQETKSNIIIYIVMKEIIEE